MGNWLATSPWGSVLKVFLGAALGSLYLVIKNDGWQNIDLDAVSAAVNAGLVIAVPLIINFINPADMRYGRR